MKLFGQRITNKTIKLWGIFIPAFLGIVTGLLLVFIYIIETTPNPQVYISPLTDTKKSRYFFEPIDNGCEGWWDCDPETGVCKKEVLSK